MDGGGLPLLKTSHSDTQGVDRFSHIKGNSSTKTREELASVYA